MRNFLAVAGKTVLFSLVLLTLVFPSLAQVTLRRAMDVNGDGKADYTIYRQTNNVWYTLRNGGTPVFTYFGLAGLDMPVPGDFDGDGKGDVAVFREVDGDWYWLNSSNGAFNVAHFGSAGDEPVGRDWDGDGKTDLAVVRRSN
ncbi:MAG TPA: FG-GAP-like repeat-containing protein, partial [Pyrinomonadaceae bacterium]|nr:FG-GAP-like repeat-containing protein [Pyrinomonadaceae bacterium]